MRLLAALLGLTLFGDAFPATPIVSLSRVTVDSLNAVFLRSNEHWDELADLNQLEKMLGTVRPTQLEFLGCLTGERRGDTILVEDWVPARNMKQLQFAVTGDCDGVAHLLGTFHTHPYRADPWNRAIKQRGLAPQDLATFAASTDFVSLVVWDVDSVDAAAKGGSGEVLYPVPVGVR